MERDRGIKLDDYEYNEVGEYWIVDADVNIVEQYILVNGKYQKTILNEDDIISSIQIPGFKCAVKSFFDKDENLKALNDVMN